MVQVGLLLSDVPNPSRPRSSSRTCGGSWRRPSTTASPTSRSASTSSTASCGGCSRCRCSRGSPPTCDPDTRLVTQIMIAPLYHPVMLAEEIATLDVVTEGRLVFGAGLGYRPEEFDYLDVPYKQRAGRFDESLELMKKLWTQETVTHHGKYWTLDDVHPHLLPGAGPAPADLDRRARRAGRASGPASTATATSARRRRRSTRSPRATRSCRRASPRAARSSGRSRCVATCLVADTREEAIVEYARVAKGRYLTYAAARASTSCHGTEQLEKEFAEAVAGHAVIGTPGRGRRRSWSTS